MVKRSIALALASALATTGFTSTTAGTELPFFNVEARIAFESGLADFIQKKYVVERELLKLRAESVGGTLTPSDVEAIALRALSLALSSAKCLDLAIGANATGVISPEVRSRAAKCSSVVEQFQLESPGLSSTSCLLTSMRFVAPQLVTQYELIVRDLQEAKPRSLATTLRLVDLISYLACVDERPWSIE